MKCAAAEKRFALAHTDFTQWHSVGPAAVGSAECWEDEVSWCTDSSVAAKHVMDNLALTHLLCVFVSLLSFHSFFSPILSSKVRQDTSWNTCCTRTLWLIDCLDIVLTAERPHVICPSSCSVNTLHFPLFPFSRRRCIYNARDDSERDIVESRRLIVSTVCRHWTFFPRQSITLQFLCGLKLA